MGRAAVDVLAALIEGAETSADEMLFEPELVVRGSTGASTRGQGSPSERA